MAMILHVDMDAFFASVEERDNPALRGRPLVVGGRPEGRGVVAAANYVARRYGIHSAMPMARAVRICPELVIVPPRHGHYGQVSQQIRAIFERYTPLVEPLSLDEAFLDVTASQSLFGGAEQIARRIKTEIHDELSLTASVGMAPTKFVAKVASDLRKPDGFVVVQPEAVQAFLDPLPVSRLWGVGKVTAGHLARLGLVTIGQVRIYPRAVLETELGQWGEHLWRLANGIDERPVLPGHEAKSISHETTFEKDVQDNQRLRDCLRELTEQVARRLRHNQLCAQTVQIKLRFPDFTTLTRARSLVAPTDITSELWRAALELMTTHLPEDHPGLRLLGMGVSGLGPAQTQQGELFEDGARAKQASIDVLADRITTRFGAGALRRGTERKRPV